jgi:O-antigen/teichoic acid export membrane protein
MKTFRGLGTTPGYTVSRAIAEPVYLSSAQGSANVRSLKKAKSAELTIASASRREWRLHSSRIGISISPDTLHRSSARPFHHSIYASPPPERLRAQCAGGSVHSVHARPRHIGRPTPRFADTDEGPPEPFPSGDIRRLLLDPGLSCNARTSFLMSTSGPNTRTVLPKTVRRFGWGVADQALSSLTNFALGIAVARNVATEELGLYTLVISIIWTVLGVSRVFSTDPLVIRYSAGTHERWRQASRASTGTAVVVGVLCGIVSAIVGSIIEGSIGSTLIVLGATFPALLVQDAWRYAFFAEARGFQAFLNDLIWGIALIGLFAFVLLTGRTTIPWLVAAWGIAAGVAALAGMIQARLTPAPQLAGRWYRSNKALSLPLLGESLIGHGSGTLGNFLLAAIAGAGALGAVRAASLLMGPAQVATMGVGLIAVPEGARTLAVSPERLRRTGITVSAAASASVLLWGLVVISLPSDVKRLLVGESWSEAAPLLLPMAISMAATAATIGARSVLAALQAARRIAKIRVVGGLMQVAAMAMGAFWDGALGAMRTLIVSETVTSGIWWRSALKVLRETPTEASDSREEARG